MRGKIAKRIRRGLRPGQTRQDYKELKQTYKSLPNTTIKEIAKLQKKQRKNEK